MTLLEVVPWNYSAHPQNRLAFLSFRLCQNVMATCLHPLPETVHTKRNFNVESRCWWGGDSDCLWSCRDALRWTKTALNAAEGAAAYVGANRPEISTEVQEVVFECFSVWLGEFYSAFTVRLMTSNQYISIWTPERFREMASSVFLL